jgi:hypothetical protein
MKKNSTNMIYYSQIELDLKNDVVHEASLKAAKQVISKQILRGRSNNLRN